MKHSLFEGGNARAINRETGEELVQAQKIQLSLFDRKKLIKEFREVFAELNNLYKRKFGEYIWEDFSVVTSNLAFNGSSQYFFDESIPDDEFMKFKPSVGDIDLTVPISKLPNIYMLLADLEDKHITKNVVYIGQNKPSIKALGRTPQINAIFMYHEGDLKTPVQIDFEGVDYEGTKPSEWAKFGHSSNWDDIKQGFKGVLHKFIILNTVRAATKANDIAVATDKSPIEKDKPIKIARNARAQDASFYSFSVDNGIRLKLAQQFYSDGTPAKVDGKFVYKIKPTSESTYLKTKEDLFKIIFKKEPDRHDLTKMESFIGFVDLMKKYLDRKMVEEIFDELVEKSLFGKGSQGLEINNPKLDFKIKWAMIEYLFKQFPYLKRKEKEVLAMANEYAKNYKMKDLVNV